MKPNFQIKALVLAMAATSVASFAEAPKESIETIKIVGEKVERSLKDTTASISVISEEELATGQYQSISEAISEIANVVVSSGATPDIRGVSGNGSATGFNSFGSGSKARVSTLVDGIAQPFVADLTGDSAIWDVEQIEVYRGPQSTLNGRNSIGGTVFIKTKEPTFDLEGAGRIAVRDQDNFIDTAVAFNAPLIDQELAVRVTAQRLDGDTYNKGIVHEGNAPSFDLNELKSSRYAAKLLWQPAAIADLKLLLNYSNNSEQGDSGRNFFTTDDPWAFKPVTQRYMDTDTETLSLKAEYAINEVISVDLLAATMDYQWVMDTYDETAAAEQLVVMDESDTTLDAKINFWKTQDPISGFVGLAYSKREQDFESTGSTEYSGIDESSSKSLYSEFRYRPIEALTVIAGGRIEKESQYRNFIFPVRNVDGVLDNEKTIRLPKLALLFDLNDNTRLGVSARRGYNAAGGAFSFTENDYYYFDQETVNTYEFTVRSSALDNKLLVNANLFYNNYRGYQALNASRQIVNMDKAVTSGIELQASYWLTDDLQLNANFGHLSTEIKDGGEQYAEVSGNELNSAPDYTLGVGLKYYFLDHFSVNASTSYVGEYFGEITNAEERKAGNYAITRLSGRYQNENWLVSLFVNNAFDKQAMTEYYPADRRYPDGYAAIVDPRNIGASVTYSF